VLRRSSPVRPTSLVPKRRPPFASDSRSRTTPRRCSTPSSPGSSRRPAWTSRFSRSAALDIGKSSLISLVSAHAHGVPISLVAPSGLYTSDAPIAALIVPAASPIKTGADFAGKTIAASSLKDLMAVATEAWIDSHGGDATKTKFLELPSAAVPAAIREGRVDGATIVDPALQEALDNGGVRILGYSFDGIAKRFPIAAFFSTNDWIAKNGDVLKRFNAALREAIVYTNAHHAETLPMIAAWSKIPQSLLAKMTRSTSATSLVPGEIQPLIDAAAKYNVIEKTFPAQELIAKL
jgi:NitT/TauT family transport system substrate-binding protein